MTDGGRATVLLVDDDEDILALVKLQLELAGDIHVVAEASTGPEALALLEQLPSPPVPTVIVLDNQMPGMSGLDVAAEVLERSPGQRIILFSAYLDRETVARARRLGITDTVSKSQLSELARIIRQPAAGSSGPG
jgi:CheY-like chemotaxis protein